MPDKSWRGMRPGPVVVTPMHVSHVRTTTPTHSHTTHYLQLLYFLFLSWRYRVRTHFLSPCFSFLLSFSFFGLEDATTLSPSTLVTPDVGPPWPLRSRRLRSPRRSRGRNHMPFSTTTWPRATRSATTPTSLGHEQLARPCHLFSRPRACNSLSHRYEIARPQQLARPRAQSTTLPIYLSRPRATRSVSDFFSCKLTPTLQRYRKFGRELPATSNSTSARSSLVISGSASITSSPHTWPTRLAIGQACRPCCLHCRYRAFEHSVSVFLSSSPSLSPFESSLTIRLGFSLFNLKFFTVDSWIFACLFPFRMFCTFTLLSFSFFQLVFFLFLKRGVL